MLASVLDDLSEDFKKIETMLSAEDRQMFQRHVEMVRSVEKELDAELQQSKPAKEEEEQQLGHAIPKLPPNVEEENDNMPQDQPHADRTCWSTALPPTLHAWPRSKSPTASATRGCAGWESTKAITRSHTSPTSNEKAYEKLIKINTWYCEQVAYLAERLASNAGTGRRRIAAGQHDDHLDQRIGQRQFAYAQRHPVRAWLAADSDSRWAARSKFDRVPHNRLLLSIAEAMGYPEKTFGNPDYCGDGPLTGLS